METTIGSTKIRLVQGDITDQDVDAVIDAASKPSMGGGGVAGNRRATRVIHAEGPVYKGGYDGENTKLERAYQSSLQLAVDEGLRTVAFPSISTGADRFPIDEAALVALNTMVRFCREQPEALDEIRVVLFSDDDMTAYKTRFDELVQTMLG